MTKIFAIADLTLRTLIRSRVFLLLVFLVPLTILGLPTLLKSDGTLAGLVQLYLRYAFSSAIWLLSIASLLSGAAAFALDIENSRIYMTTTKPVRALQLWVGKWLGLMVMNALLLCLSGVLLFSMLHWIAHSTISSTEEQHALTTKIMVARKQIYPESAPQSNNRETKETSSLTIPPGGFHEWNFYLPPHLQSGDNAIVQYQFATSRPVNQSPVTGLWLVRSEGMPYYSRIKKLSLPNVLQQFELPENVLASGKKLTLAYVNVGSEKPVTILFSHPIPVSLLIHAGGIEINIMRALLLIFCRLSFFSSLGLTIGALFSFPVAVFVSLAFMIITGFNTFIGQVTEIGLAGRPGALVQNIPLAWEKIVRGMCFILYFLVPPLSHLDPLRLLSSGLLVSWQLVGEGFFILICVYSVLLALIGSFIFSRRELGLSG